MNDEAPGEASYGDALRAAFACDEADLEANRGGALSPAQAKRAAAATSFDAWFNAGFAILFAAVMYGVLWFILDSGKLFDFAQGISFAEVVILVVAGGLPTACLGYAAYTIRVHFRSRDAVAVASIEGPASLGEMRWRGAVAHEVSVGGETFPLSATAHAALIQDRPVRLYYVESSRVVVAAEPAS